MFIRFILIFFLGYLAYRLFRELFPVQKRGEFKDENGDVIDDMVQDPECHVYVPRKEAIRRRVNGIDEFFCSDKCAEKFENARKH